MMDVSSRSLPLLEAIARQKELEHQLTEATQAAARYNRLFDHSALGIFIGNSTGELIDANPRALSLLGYDREELVGTNIAHLIHPDDLKTVSIYEGPKAALAGRAYQVERRLLRKNGDYLPTRVHFAIYDDSQPLFQMLFQDITVEKAAEATTASALTMAQSANAAKSVFLANMSHEIRTPLNGIMGMLQLALASSPSEEIRDYLETALTSSEALLQVLADVLDVARLDAGRLTLCQDVFTLSDVIRPIVDFFDHEARLKGLRFTSRLDPDMPESLCGDPARLRQILHNLLSNAIKYTATGSVRLDVHLTDCDDNTAYIQCIVTDTGIGIAPDKQDIIFDAFSQADDSLTRPYGGCGLGLTIVKGLAALMDATLHICSDPGQGTAVRLSLSLPLGQQTQRMPVKRPLPRIEGTRVLVVEDERINQLTIAAMLRKFGCIYEQAANGLEALQRLGQTHFDCVLMDMQMPQLDGLETTRRIRAGSDGVLDPTVPIIALTAHAQDADRDAALAAGVDDYVSKPVDMDALARAIGKRLGIYS